MSVKRTYTTFYKGTFLLVLLSFACSTLVLGQSAHKWLRKADANYEKGNYAMAEEQYRKSLEKEQSLNGNYNLGVTAFDQQRHEESIESYENAINKTEENLKKSQVFYNLANSYRIVEDFEQSIDAYKEAIRLNPEDVDARKNLYLTKLLRRQQQQQEQQQQPQEGDPQESDEQNQGEGQPNEEQQEQEKQEGQEPQDGEEQAPQEEEIENTPGEPGEKQELSKEDALKLLQVIEDEEKKVQEKLRKVGARKKKQEKDW